MRFQTDAIGVTAVILILLAYLSFGYVFLFRKKPPQTEEAKRSSAATLGIVLQFFGFCSSVESGAPAMVAFPSFARWRRC